MGTEGTDLIDVAGVGLVSQTFADRRNEFLTARDSPGTNPEVILEAARRLYDAVDIEIEGEMSEFCRQVDKLSQANQTKSWMLNS